MKTLISMLALAVCCFFFQKDGTAQNGETEYVTVEYMKVKPGMWQEYRECERAWKLVHQARKKAGYITGWELERVVFPAGTGMEYDFLAITHYKNWGAILAENNETWDAVFQTLPEDQRTIANRAEELRDLVKREIWSGGDRVFATGGDRPKFAVENFMRIADANWDAWEKMEMEFVKPVHQKSIELGTRAGWMMAYMVLPRGADYPYRASTIDFFNSWEQMGLDEGKSWETVYPGMTYEEIGARFENTRTIAKTEVRRLVDYVE